MARIEITVTFAGRPATWDALNSQSAIRQAKLETARGGVAVVRRNGRVIWTSDEGAVKS